MNQTARSMTDKAEKHYAVGYGPPLSPQTMTISGRIAEIRKVMSDVTTLLGNTISEIYGPSPECGEGSKDSTSCIINELDALMGDAVAAQSLAQKIRDSV